VVVRASWLPMVKEMGISAFSTAVVGSAEALLKERAV
jgi:hypothetical protein